MAAAGLEALNGKDPFIHDPETISFSLSFLPRKKIMGSGVYHTPEPKRNRTKSDATAWECTATVAWC
jgi:hypothetical protein